MEYIHAFFSVKIIEKISQIRHNKIPALPYNLHLFYFPPSNIVLPESVLDNLCGLAFILRPKSRFRVKRKRNILPCSLLYKLRVNGATADMFLRLIFLET
jgi:hypothetical protein